MSRMSKSKRARINAERKDRERRVREIRDRLFGLKIPIGTKYGGRYDSISVSTAGSRIGAQGARCRLCNKPIGEVTAKRQWDDIIVVATEIKHGWFRGDDEVGFWHPDCFVTAHQTNPPSETET